MKVFDIPYFDIYLYVYVTKHMNRGNNLKRKPHVKEDNTCP